MFAAHKSIDGLRNHLRADPVWFLERLRIEEDDK